MVIPLGYSLATFIFGGAAAPNGAVTTLGVAIFNEDSQTENAQTLYDTFDENVLHLLSNQLVMTGVMLKDGPTDIGSVVEVSGSSDGNDISQAFSSNVAMLVSKNTASGGRRNKGRLFIPGLAEGRAVVNTIDADRLDDLQTGFDDFYAAIYSAGMIPVVLHSSDDHTPTPITGFTVQSTLATQRRRLRR